MLHIIDPERHKNPTLPLKDILNHRADYLISEDFEPSLTGDVFETPETKYLAYQDHSYGVIGSARFLPTASLPFPLKKALPANHEIPFVLVDCLFHIPEESPFFQCEDKVIESQYGFKLKNFYSAVTLYLENQAFSQKTPLMYFYLNEESVGLLTEFSSRRISLLREVSWSGENAPYWLGYMDLTNLLHSYDQRRVFQF